MDLVPEAFLAVRSGVPAGRAVIERAAGAGGATMEAGAAALRDMDDFARRGGLIDRRQRHRLAGHRRQTKAKREHGCSKNSHLVFPFLSFFAAMRQNRVYANNLAAR
jgi:hypothetical protein